MKILAYGDVTLWVFFIYKTLTQWIHKTLK